MQKWKTDPNLYNTKRNSDGKKKLDYYNTYIKEFLSADPLRDWESIERCKELWNFFLNKINTEVNLILDAGTKDGQFPKWLNENNYTSFGIEIDDQYVKYAQEKNRPVYKGDITKIEADDNTFDVIFCHHVLGLTPDITKAYQEMLRVCKKNGYVITLKDIPGNTRKHYSMIHSTDDLNYILSKCPKYENVYKGYWKKERKSEYVCILKKK